MSTAENEIDDTKDSDTEPHDLDDAETKPLTPSIKSAAKKPAKAAEDDEDEESDDDAEEDSDDDEAPPSSKKPRAKAAPARPEKRSSARAESEATGSSFKNILTISRRGELRSFFDSLVAYVVVGLSIIICGLWFFVASGGIWQIDRANFGRMFEALPWLLALIVIPLVTMRSIAEEKRSGTLELLITMPVTDTEVILGKYFAALGMCVVLLACSLLFPIAMFVWPWHLGALDWGPVWTGYLGLALFSAAGTALGLLFSGITESQIIAFFLTAGTLLFLQIIGGVVETLPGVVGDTIAFISFETRFAPFARGLIDTRAVIYFVSIAVLCLLVAFRQLESRKWK